MAWGSGVSRIHRVAPLGISVFPSIASLSAMDWTMLARMAMLNPAFASAWSTWPHWHTKSFPSLVPSLPHREHSFDVFLGSTKTIGIPLILALYWRKL